MLTAVVEDEAYTSPFGYQNRKSPTSCHENLNTNSIYPRIDGIRHHQQIIFK